MLVGAAAVMELVAIGLREAGMTEGAADIVSFLFLVAVCARLLREFPPDRASLDWAAGEPGKAAVLLGVLIGALLTGWFLATEDDRGEALGASALAWLVAGYCAWASRRAYATRGGG